MLLIGPKYRLCWCQPGHQIRCVVVNWAKVSVMLLLSGPIVFAGPIDHVCSFNRGRPWRYSVIPRTPDFQTEYQIRRNSTPAGIPVFAAIWGPDFRPSIIISTNMFKQIKQIRITLMTMFKVDPSPPNELR